MSGHHLGIDVGGTATRWVLCAADGREVSRGVASGATGHVFNPAELHRLGDALRMIAAEVSVIAPGLGGVAAGITGFGSVVELEVKQLLGAIFNLESDKLTVIDDIMLAYAGAFAPGEGHLVSAGTGSIGVHLGIQAGYVRVGGRGILVDDGGSGSWIALRALDELFRHLDRHGSFSGVQPLADAVFGIVGGEDWHVVRQFVYGGDRGRIGTLATGVAQAAARGDALSLRILDQAGRELAALAQALIARAGEKPVGFIGGVLQLHPAVTAAIRAELPSVDVRLPAVDAALTAARMHGDDFVDWRDCFATLVRG